MLPHSRSGNYKQLSHYPRSRDGAMLNKPRVADYRGMEFVARKELVREEIRLATFNNWPADRDYIKPEELAKAGFYYDSDNITEFQQDRVKCLFCRGTLHSWERGDEPIKEHRRAFSTCPFILSMDVGNKPKLGTGVISETLPILSNSAASNAKGLLTDTVYHGGPIPRRSNLNLMTVNSRKNTFAKYGENVGDKIRPDKVNHLSQNGFYYTGDEDVIECYKCHFKSRIANDGSVELHFDNTPLCPYLMQLNNHYRSDSNPEINVSNMPPKLTDSEAATRMDSWVVRKTIELGFDEDLIKYVVLQHVNFSGEDFLSIPLLIDKLLDLQSLMQKHGIDIARFDALDLFREIIEKEKEKRKLIILQKNKELCNKIEQHPEIIECYWEDPEIKTSQICNKNVDVKYQEMINEKLKALQYCKICMDRPVDVIFIPCHHIICCTDCTSNINSCPICRRPIEDTLVVNLE